MYSEWADVCTVIYGGNFASGGYFWYQANAEKQITVYETIYGLGNALCPLLRNVLHTTKIPTKNQPIGTNSGDDSVD